MAKMVPTQKCEKNTSKNNKAPIKNKNLLDWI